MSDSRPQIGDLLGDRFEIQGYLGRGAMGVLLQAKDLISDQEFALKFPVELEGLDPSGSEAERLRSEYSAATEFQHDNVVKVFDIFELDGFFFLKMELIKGTSLGAWIDPLRGFGSALIPEASVVEICLAICNALEAIKEAGFQHRDLKPNNIMIRRRWSPRLAAVTAEPVLIDFGVSASIDAPAAERGGTPAYSPPEQKAGRTSPNTDIFAFGCLLYELVTGRVATNEKIDTNTLPVDADSRLQTTMLLGDGVQIPLPSSFNPRVNPEIEKLIKDCMQWDWKDRPGIEEVKARLSRIDPERWSPEKGSTIPGLPTWKLHQLYAETTFGQLWIVKNLEPLGSEESKLYEIYDKATVLAATDDQKQRALLRDRIGEQPQQLWPENYSFSSPPFFSSYPLYSGGNLSAWIDSVGGWSEVSREQRERFILDLTIAVAAWHEAGVPHQHIRIENIFVDVGADGTDENARLKLARFNFDTSNFGNASISQAGGIGPSGSGEEKTPRDLIRSDVSALGEICLRIALGDFSRAALVGSLSGIENDLKVYLLAATDPQNERFESAGELATILRALPDQRQEIARVKQHEKKLKNWQLSFALVVVFLLGFYAISIFFKNKDLEREKEKSRESFEFLKQMFLAGDPEETEGLGAQLSALGLFELGADRLERNALHEQPEARAELLFTIGRALARMGDFERSALLLEDAVALYRSFGANRHADLAESLNQLALVQLEQLGNLERAKASNQEAIALANSLADSERALARYRRTHVSILSREGHLDQAMRELEDVIAIQRKVLVQEQLEYLDLAESLNELGTLRIANSDLGGAKASLEEALSIRKRLLGTQDSSGDSLEGNEGAALKAASVYGNLARLALEEGNLEQADRIYHQALDDFRNLYGPTHFKVFDTLNDVGWMFEELDFPVDAEKTYREVLFHLESSLQLPRYHPRVLTSLQSLAYLLASSGRLDEATDLYQEILELRTAHQGTEHEERLITLRDLGWTLQLGESWQAAERRLSEAIGIYSDQGTEASRANAANASLMLIDLWLTRVSVEDRAPSQQLLRQSLKEAFGALETWKGLEGGIEGEGTAWVYETQAEIFEAQEDFPQALAHHRDALNIFSKAESPPNRINKSRKKVARVLVELGGPENLKEAWDLLDQALDSYDTYLTKLNPEHYRAQHATAIQGRIEYLQAGDDQAGNEIRQQAREKVENAYIALCKSRGGTYVFTREARRYLDEMGVDSSECNEIRSNDA